jgi:hypothetical protein
MLCPSLLATMPGAFSTWFDNPEHSDVVLHLGTATAAPVAASNSKTRKARAAAPPHARTFHAHAVVLSAQSAYFKARMGGRWQRTHAKRKVELVELVEETELEAMELLLRLMYGQSLPDATSVHTLFQCLRLADRFQSAACGDELLHRLAAIPASSIDRSFVAGVCDAPPGVRRDEPPFRALVKVCAQELVRVYGSAPAATNPSPDLTAILDLDVLVDVYGAADPALPLLQPLLDACLAHLVRLYGDVPATIRDAALRDQFCALPHAAVLAWAECDELRVTSENDVVFLLSAWVAAQEAAGRPATAGQLEQLAHQVRVFHCGSAYLAHCVPNLAWFKGCGNFKRISMLLRYKYAGFKVQDVHPGNKTTLVGRWVACPRSGAAAIGPPLAWRVSPSQLQQADDGQTVHCPASAYVNGFMVQLSLALRTAKDGGSTLGIFVGLAPRAATRPVPWAHAPSVLVRLGAIKVVGSELEHAKCGALPGCLVCGETWGWPNFFGKSASSVAELVAPYLRDGHLHIEAEPPAMDG